ncbi:type II toxin-antitoxin system HicB family antitoxin [Paenibacillus thiaminolyticus]|uniref:Type II toxin-antitoxin system HicB family antitoxin n=1 Tax=Paenibacillus thiaminolyticus TaxID=49283 RepID=A0AAP9J1M4_PANTH|nr:type II toxin-antitoxin system HicB family antitoxin [Paenibacillus thiaminolyticus]MCY9533740.1 type II toxin-antitoxin system HicB family antitoxin [Paenibacillus thiaminolyticus]MCY9600231.1 type II toxin-antitoxin system HicB family antitoxin [Paenibacillus thiaminolyticus]MCY9607791.1 type II toxin-antitoxin system HicB family antitoxin [Paenibacillus thiaminolyticus]MCY9611956.1 type II toxin-antitoxin system HicB family antitoxin [Paenibacillus thiaminolyticus]MCY9617824.1 type II to
MPNYIYPVVVEETPTGVSMYFPDFPGTAVTAPSVVAGIKDAKAMLIHRIEELHDNNDSVPEPSGIDAIELEAPNDCIIYVEVFVIPPTDDKTVTKNCTLPKWLRDAGEDANLNFSQLLQQSVREALGIEKRP